MRAGNRRTAEVRHVQVAVAKHHVSGPAEQNRPAVIGEQGLFAAHVRKLSSGVSSLEEMAAESILVDSVALLCLQGRISADDSLKAPKLESGKDEGLDARTDCLLFMV